MTLVSLGHLVRSKLCRDGAHVTCLGSGYSLFHADCARGLTRPIPVSGTAPALQPAPHATGPHFQVANSAGHPHGCSSQCRDLEDHFGGRRLNLRHMCEFLVVGFLSYLSTYQRVYEVFRMAFLLVLILLPSHLAYSKKKKLIVGLAPRIMVFLALQWRETNPTSNGTRSTLNKQIVFYFLN